MKTIQDAILELVAEFGMSPKDINGGNCEEFADKLVGLIPSAKQMWDWEAEDGGVNRGWTWCHCFVKYEGRYYDAECVDGVSEWWNLPWFLRPGAACHNDFYDMNGVPK